MKFLKFSLSPYTWNSRDSLQWENLLEEIAGQGAPTEKASVLSATLTIGEPLQLEKSYVWEVTISEHTGEGHIDLQYEFEVVEPQLASANGAESERFLYLILKLFG